MSWPLVKLADVCEINIGKTPARANDEYWGEGEPWLSISDMNQGLHLFGTKEQITRLAVKETGIKRVEPGTVLFSFKLSIGKIGIAMMPMYTNEAIAALPVLDPKRICSSYLVYALSWLDAESKTDRAVMGATLNKRKLAELEIPLPPLPEQKRIAAILDKADAIRRKRQQAIQFADDFLRSVFLDMFGDPVTNPKGWREVELGGLIVKGPTNGLYKHSSEYGSGTRILRIDGFYGGRITGQESMRRVRLSSQEVEKFKLGERSIVINRVNSREYLGKAAFISGMSEDSVFESNMMNFSVDESVVNPVFLVELLGSLYVKRQILSSAKDAVNQSSINQQDVKSLRILLPPLDLQERFEVFLNKLEMFTKRTSVWKGVADEACLSITNKAFSGQL